MTDSSSVKREMSELLKQPIARLRDDMLLSDLVSESFVLIETVIELQETFGIRLIQDDMRHIRTVGDLVLLMTEKASRTPLLR